jgi:hypothetical protein
VSSRWSRGREWGPGRWVRDGRSALLLFGGEAAWRRVIGASCLSMWGWFVWGGSVSNLRVLVLWGGRPGGVSSGVSCTA